MSRKKKFWKQVDRYFAIIEAEIRKDEPDAETVDFYLWKIKRRFEILKRYVDAEAR